MSRNYGYVSGAFQNKW